MTQPPPPPAPPRPSPTVGSNSLPPWALYSGGAAIALVVAGFGLGWFGGDDSSASLDPGQPLVTLPGGSSTTFALESTSTTDAPTTSLPSTTTTTAGTSSTNSSTTTTSSTTTSTTTTTSTIPPLLTDSFDGATTAFPLFPSEFMEATVDDAARLRVVGKGADFVLPVMYPSAYPDAEITFQLYPLPDQPDAKYGAVVLSEDPADGLAFYVMAYVDTADGNVWVKRWSGTEFAEEESAPIPDGFTIDAWNELHLVVSGSSVEVYVNGGFALLWSGSIAPAPAWWGPMIIPGDDFDVMLIDDVLVEGIAG